ncbi:type VI secretion system baseplate subunit TssK [uncultured Cocleimonas sp.]|uniref:type VI secretion system baseplate subunit TssK n=1 Tax=uncultured Cocleimonas sp. TaxID=1051587 RepID=UPI0026335988|nr:type VI secretion system baseplate subunit TssK [uncultured Cocleimonas sp.]
MNKDRVVWHEGLFLRPQHLQQQERFIQNWVEGRCQGIRPFNWGVTNLEIDPQLLKLGKIAIVRAQGIFADGTPFGIPNDTPAPAPFEVPKDDKNCLIYLAVPLIQPNALLMTEESEGKNKLTRYQINDIQVGDLHTGKIQGEADLQVGCLNISILSENDKLNAYSVIPIARIVESTKDKLVKLDESYIPAVMHCNTSEQIMGFIKEVQALLKHRGEALASRLAAPGSAGVSEITDFLILQLVNKYEPLFRHLQINKDIFPEELYRILIVLAGELATFTSETRRPIEFKEYIHDQQQFSFEFVMNEIRKALSSVIEQKAIGLDIEEHKYGIWVAIINDKSLLDSCTFVLAVKADVATEKIRSKFPRQSTISSVEKIRELVNSHIPGIDLTALAVAPRQIPYHSGFSYFEMNSAHEFWAPLSTSGGLAVHVGTKLENLELELWAIRD